MYKLLILVFLAYVYCTPYKDVPVYGDDVCLSDLGCNKGYYCKTWKYFVYGYCTGNGL